MRFRGLKWWKEKRQRDEHLAKLYVKRVKLFEVWHNMLYPVKKTITITGSDPNEVSAKATAAMSKLYELRSFDQRDTRYSGEVKRLHSLEREPVLEINQFEKENVVEVVATISYAQYMLRPGFTEEAFYAAVEAFDHAKEEQERYRKECAVLGM